MTSQSPTDRLASRSLRPAFVVGVTGHMQLRDDTQAIKQTLRRVFEWLRADVDVEFPEFRIPSDTPVYGLGLKNTPIVLLSSLAPGADALAAEVALAEAGTGGPQADAVSAIRVVVPTPFPLDLYRDATTFRPRTATPDDIARNHKTLDALLTSIPGDDVFAVLLREDTGAGGAPAPTAEELHERFKADRDDPERRRLRYRAAGEYVAAFSDLLIAIWDGAVPAETSTAGTSRIVAAKLRGFTPGLGSETSRFAWAGTGPVLHVVAATTGGNTSHAAPSPNQETSSTAQLLLPDGLPSGEGERVLWRRAANLEAFNRDTPAGPSDLSDAQRELRVLLGELHGVRHFERQATHLLPVAATRRHAAVVSRTLDGVTRTLMLRLCRLVAAAAIFLHLYAHWHAQHETGHGPLSLQNGFLLVALLLACAAPGFFFPYERKGIESRRYDSRALAEGLRVQFYWGVAGIGTPVSSSYMQRQGGELGWIRSAIASLALPHDRWRTWFAELPTEAKVAALKAVADQWIDVQSRFYTRAREEALRNDHLFHRLGWGMALAGLMHGALLLIWNLAPPLEAQGRTFGVAASSLALAASLVMRLASHMRPSHDAHVSTGLFPSSSPVPVALFTIGLTLPLPFLLPSLTEMLPDTHDLWIIVLGSLLVVGAALLAWREKRLYAEHGRQYQAMAELFAAADQQLRKHLDEASVLASRGRQNEAERSIALGQEMVFHLGKEALDEHAEWLILHRARPLELFMAG
jgi:hypothetical protein